MTFSRGATANSINSVGFTSIFSSSFLSSGKLSTSVDSIGCSDSSVFSSPTLSSTFSFVSDSSDFCSFSTVTSLCCSAVGISEFSSTTCVTSCSLLFSSDNAEIGKFPNLYKIPFFVSTNHYNIHYLPDSQPRITKQRSD